MSQPTMLNVRARADTTRVIVWTVRILLMVTWLVMVWGAATRASRAGISCPDWPLCHGHLVPPTDAAAYPASPLYEVHKVFLEFTHRVLAGTLACGAVLLSILLVRAGRKTTAIALVVIVSAQVAMGAVTVALRNAPVTVIAHLALALAFVGTLLAVTPPVSSNALDRAWRATAVIITLQLLLGGVVSSREFGLACADFPLCNGLPVPVAWTIPIAWQFAHRICGLAVLGASLVLTIVTLHVPALARDRARALVFAAATVVQVGLGGINVWYRIPPIASALHLGVAVLIFALVVQRALGASSRAAAIDRVLDSSMAVPVSSGALD